MRPPCDRPVAACVCFHQDRSTPRRRDGRRHQLSETRVGDSPRRGLFTILEDVEHVCAEAFAELRRVEPQQHRINPDGQLHGKSSLAARQLSSGLGGE